MTNLDKYNELFVRTFEVNIKDLPSLQYQSVSAWDSVGHMTLISAIEDTFNIMLDTDDIIDFKSYENGKKILSKEEYGVSFDK